MKQGFQKALMYLCVAFCFIFPITLSAKGPAEEADAMFQDKKYQEALDIWYGLIRTGNSSAGIYYNIGVTESLLQHTPQAILAYEKALRFSPANKRIHEAISMERKKIEGNVIPVPEFFLSRWMHAMTSILRPGYWAMVGLLLLVISSLIFLKGNSDIKVNHITKQKSIFALSAIGALFLLFASISYHQIYREDEAVARVQCDFRRAPTEESPQIRSLFPGEKVKVSDQIGGWYQVQLLNLDEGWIKSDCIEFITIPQGKPTKG